MFSCYKGLCISDLSHACYILSPFHYGRLGQPAPNNIRWSVLNVVACGCKFLHMPVTSSFLHSVIIDRILLSIVVLCCRLLFFVIDRCSLLSIFVLCCGSLFFVVDLCSLLLIFVPCCRSLFFVVDRCSSLSIVVHSCRSLFFVVERCSLLSISVLYCRSLFFVVDLCYLLSMFFVVDRCSLTGTLLKFKIAMNAIYLKMYIIMKYLNFLIVLLDYGPNNPRFDSRKGQNIFSFLKESTQSLGPTQPPVQWVPGFLSLGIKWRGMNLSTHCIQYRS